MFQRAGYYGRATAPVDNVPDGAGAMAAGWAQNGVSRVESGTLNPPLVTLTESIATAEHISYNNAVPSLGPRIRVRFYLRAGTRRYVVIIPALAGNQTPIVVDTTTWTVVDSLLVGGTIDSQSITDLGGGDRLVDMAVTFTAAGANYTGLHGALSATGSGTGWTYSYAGDGSTILVRRVDMENLPSLGAGTATKAATTGTALTGATQHTPAGSAALIRYLARTTVTLANTAPTATFQGKTVVFPAGSQAHLDTVVGRSVVGVGYVTGLTPATAGSLVLTCNRALGQLVARVDDLVNFTAANVGAVNASSYGSTAKNNHSTAVTTQAAGSILAGVVGGTSGSIDPLTQAAGWTEQSEDVTGTNATTDVAATFITKTGGAAAATETALATGATTAANWAAALLELKA